LWRGRSGPDDFAKIRESPSLGYRVRDLWMMTRRRGGAKQPGAGVTEDM